MAAAPRDDERGAEPKGERTRRLIVDTALRLFRERGYEQTTMRLIAAEAGVSVGNAYYYFSSKEHLIQAYYEQMQSDHLGAARPVLEASRDLETRLLGVMRARVDTIHEYKEFAASFFRVAANPRSPLSPFSTESAPAREMSIALFTEVVDGSAAKVLPELRAQLPTLLWLYQMGVVLFWVHDESPGAERTYQLVDRTVPLVVRLINLSRFRVVRPVVAETLDLLALLQRGDPR